MREAQSWQDAADTLGFKDTEEMLKHLYIHQNFSLEQLHQVLGYCTWSIRRRLIEYGVPLRDRGGPNNRLGKRRLKHLSDAELDMSRAANIASKYQVHISTVYAEIRFREKEKRNELLSHHANKLFSRLGTANDPSHGAGPVLPSPPVPGVFQDEE